VKADRTTDGALAPLTVAIDYDSPVRRSEHFHLGGVQLYGVAVHVRDESQVFQPCRRVEHVLCDLLS